MDLLGDLLRESGLQRRLLGQLPLPAGTALRFPCEKSIGFHVVTQGEAWLHWSGSGPGLATPLHLRKGDAALMARGCHHVLSTEASLDGVEVQELSAAANLKGTAPRATVVSGAYQLWHTPVHPFFRELPEWFVLRGEDQGGLDPLVLAISLLGQEVTKPDLGSATVVDALLDVLFNYLLRKIVATQGEEAGRWSGALRDVQVRRAVELMHADSARPWTLELLASEVGLSRASLAQKFRQAMGDTPLHYLTTVRMQKAMGLLRDTRDTLETVAAQVGYQDAFGFSKVFKRVVGVSPRDFRQQDREDRSVAWRF